MKRKILATDRSLLSDEEIHTLLEGIGYFGPVSPSQKPGPTRRKKS